MAKDNTPNLFGIEEADEVNIGSVIRVSFETGADAEFDYNLPKELGGIEIGYPKFREHIASVTTLMKTSTKWEDFRRMINRALPKWFDMALFDQPKKD
ncbi:MAG: hypothetical protein KAJ07_07825 [Planctomycetes bacterium]|nr:hypothetical protein [Planctomycetota bacterium]